jgi:hypothetical protein
MPLVTAVYICITRSKQQSSQFSLKTASCYKQEFGELGQYICSHVDS